MKHNLEKWTKLTSKLLSSRDGCKLICWPQHPIINSATLFSRILSFPLKIKRAIYCFNSSDIYGGVGIGVGGGVGGCVGGGGFGRGVRHYLTFDMYVTNATTFRAQDQESAFVKEK